MSVALKKFDGRYESFKDLINSSGGFNHLKKESKVLIKPNIVYGGGALAKSPKYGIVTTTRVIEYIVMMLKEFGVENITIGEGSVANEELQFDSLTALKSNELDALAEKYGLSICDLNHDACETIRMNGHDIGVAKTALEADFFINVPVLKTHFMCKVSLACKNLKGCIPIPMKKLFHKKNLDKMIALLANSIKPDLTVIDGIYTLERGPISAGRAYRSDILVAGTDMLECDIVGSTLLGIDPQKVEHLSEYAALVKKGINCDAVEIIGDSIDELKCNLEYAFDPEILFTQAGIEGIRFKYPGKAWCTGCVTNCLAYMSTFAPAYKGLKFDGIEFCSAKETVPDTGSKQVVLLGNCAIHKNKNVADAIQVKGCPPQISTITTTLAEVLKPVGSATMSKQTKAANPKDYSDTTIFDSSLYHIMK